MTRNKFFQIAVYVILILLILVLANQIPHITSPILMVIRLVFLPIILGGFIYYLLRPAVRWIEKIIKHKITAIILTFLLTIALITAVFYFAGEIIYDELTKLAGYIQESYYSLNQARKIPDMDNLKLNLSDEFNFKEQMIVIMQKILKSISEYNYGSFLSSIANLGAIILLIPFVVFFFLKDDKRIYNSILSYFSKEKREIADSIFSEINQILSAYIGGQLIVAFILGLLMLGGYLLIGLKNAVALALIAMVTSLIPIVGPTIGLLPAVFIASTSGLLMVVKVLVVLVVVQQLEGNVIRPMVMGKQLEIYPLTVIFILFIAIFLFGLLGALFAIPTYAVIRVLVRNFVNFKI